MQITNREISSLLYKIVMKKDFFLSEKQNLLTFANSERQYILS
jgi:hypothetical protein